jgi:hypothetical protein
VTWTRAPGTPPPLIVENRIPVTGDPSAGLAIFKIAYSDGRAGILVVRCMLVGTPGAVFEGVLGTRAFALFWDAERPQDEPFVNANRTIFFVTRGTAAPPPAAPVAQRPGSAMRCTSSAWTRSRQAPSSAPAAWRTRGRPAPSASPTPARARSRPAYRAP